MTAPDEHLPVAIHEARLEAMSELRYDRLTGDSVIVAPDRSARPHSHRSDGAVTEGCPFCPGNESETPEPVLELRLKSSPSPWFVRVFPNMYPIVSPDEGEGRKLANATFGMHEVVVETPLHDQELSQRTAEELLLTLQAYRERLGALLAMPGVRHVSVFRNKGPDAGASLGHPHSQIVALSYVPAAAKQNVQRWRRHRARTGSCLLCDELEHERDARHRVIVQRDGFLVYVPVATARPAEIRLAPILHTTSYIDVNDETLARLSPLLLSTVGRLQTAYEDASYNLVLQTWPRSHTHDEALHWFLRIIPRTSVLGGFELSTGDYVITTPPEEAAARYRDAV
jgi:UDPglucose--hexose-1-phosphate uridylyltransferase